MPPGKAATPNQATSAVALIGAGESQRLMQTRVCMTYQKTGPDNAD